MWCESRKSRVAIAATACILTASLIITDAVLAVRKRNYTPQQFRTVLHALGYNVKVSSAPLTEPDAKAAIQAFQKGYKLKSTDGVAGPQTQDYAAEIVEILQANLNLVLKPKPPLPRNQYYGPQTEAAVKEYQKKSQLQETGVADLSLRQKLDKEAEDLLTKPATTEPSPSPSPSPRRSRKPKPTATPTTSPTSTPKTTPTPEATPSSTATPSDTATPEATPSSTATPEATPSSTATPEATPSTKPTTKPTPKPKK